MANEPKVKPSFSLGRKWSVGFDMVVRTVVVLAVVVMVNYLGGQYFERRYLSSAAQIDLSSRTLNLLKSVTNDVKVILYYDKDEDYYPTVDALLKDYGRINPHIKVTTVDYLRDAAKAVKIKGDYKLPSAADKKEKNFIIFDCDGKLNIQNGSLLVDYQTLRTTNQTEMEFVRKAVAFRGEMVFSSMLLAVTSPKPMKAYFLEGHGEHSISDDDDTVGYTKLAELLQQNYIQAGKLSLLGTNDVPGDCNLLVIAGPTTVITNAELDRINKYLSDGGRLLALFSPFARGKPTGLERILVRWDVVVGDAEVRDAQNTVNGQDVVVREFNTHPIVNPLARSALHLVLPRSVRGIVANSRDANPRRVTELAFASPGTTVSGKTAPEGHPFAVAATVENSVAGVITERGNTRIVAVGDSTFLGNQMIESAGNRDFAGLALNWLLERTQLVEGLGPRSVTEFRLNMTETQQHKMQLILLAALPGGILLFGGLVWLRRRK